MTEERSHQFIHEAELAERYVAGRMPDAERVAFEDHFAACAQCQRDIRFAGAVRAALARPAAVAARRASGDLALLAATAGAATAGAANAGAANRGVATGRRRGRWLAGAAVAAGIAAVAIVNAMPSGAVKVLGAVDEPPAYLGIAVRSTAGRGEAIFESAMAEYAHGHYAAAGDGLQAALAAGEDSIPTEFFIGASALFAGDAHGAADAFARVVAKGESPYRDEAQWYRAKALLRLARARDALAALAAHAPDDPAMAARLSALADSVKRAGVR